MTTIKIRKMTFAQMKVADKKVDHKWFSPGAMDFFNTRLTGTPDKWNLFLYNNQYDPNRDTPLVYMVGMHIPKSGKTFTVCGTQGFATQEEATKYRKEVAAAFDLGVYRELSIIENMAGVEVESNTTTFYTSEGDTFKVRTDGKGDPNRRIVG